MPSLVRSSAGAGMPATAIGSECMKAARGAVKWALAKVNLKLERLDGSLEDDRRYIPFKRTMAAAKAAGLPVGDYIEARYDLPGVAGDTLRRMRDLGVFANPVGRVCEVGPGSGRYLRETLKMCHPAHYEIYETATDWARWLIQEYKVVHHPTDGRSLAHTPTESVDLVHAHKTIPVLSFISGCRYLCEMARVARIGGKVVFDVMTEDCPDPGTVQRWLAQGSGCVHYPSTLPKSVVTALLAKLGLRCDGEFLESMSPGFTQYFVTTKCASGDSSLTVCGNAS